MIYRWEPHSTYTETRELYNLADDIGETQNLAKQNPEKVTELEKLIEKFITDTDAAAPKPNPDYREAAAKANRAPEAGLVPKMAKLNVSDGVAIITKDGKTPFLGTALVKKLSGPLSLQIQMRGGSGEPGRIQWKTTEQETFLPKGQQVEFATTKGSEWQDVKLDVPVKGAPGILRIYLPTTEENPVEIKLIEIKGGKGKSLKWQF